MFYVILGAATVGGAVVLGVNKVVNVGKSIRENGLIETTVAEAQKVGHFAVKVKDHAMKEMEK